MTEMADKYKEKQKSSRLEYFLPPPEMLPLLVFDHYFDVLAASAREYLRAAIGANHRRIKPRSHRSTP
ncbi:MAG TPA: hypothetical protein VFZ07_00080 [Dongiaceae bacterium]